jgi:hypothetical protein
MRRAWSVLVLVLVLLLPQRAEASPRFIDGKGAVAIAAIGLVLGVLVTPVGAMITTLEGEPTKEWGRSSLVFGTIATVAGGITVGAAAAGAGDEFYWFGGIASAIGLNGLMWGAASEATLPPEDPRSVGRRRSSTSRAPAMFTIRGSF